ncbi:MAG: hypothetical protein Q8K86_05775 [Candidatus Nanopelagicaceae bacterium]|nr:hypothetical protein [Candidatus Nanopelagicaceae bacterium]
MPGGTVAMLADQANELRSALLERAAAVSLDISATIPDVVVAGVTPIQHSWLTGMRAAVEAIIAGGRYGQWVANMDPYYRDFTVYADAAALLTLVHATFTDCGAGDAWVAVSQYDAPLATHVRELYYCCELLEYATVTIGYSLGDTQQDLFGSSLVSFADAVIDRNGHMWG